MSKFLLPLFLLLTSPAAAECSTWGYTADGTKVCTSDDLVNRNPVFSTPPTKEFLLIINDGAPTAKLLFQMEPGACLKGPLKFFSSKGQELFSLTANVDFPAGCSKDQPK